MLRKGGKEARQAVLFFQQGDFGGIERQQREERYFPTIGQGQMQEILRQADQRRIEEKTAERRAGQGLFPVSIERDNPAPPRREAGGNRHLRDDLQPLQRPGGGRVVRLNIPLRWQQQHQFRPRRCFFLPRLRRIAHAAGDEHLKRPRFIRREVVDVYPLQLVVFGHMAQHAVGFPQCADDMRLDRRVISAEILLRDAEQIAEGVQILPRLCQEGFDVQRGVIAHINGNIFQTLFKGIEHQQQRRHIVRRRFAHHGDYLALHAVGRRDEIQAVEVVVCILEDRQARRIKQHLAHRFAVLKIGQAERRPVRAEGLLDMRQQARLHLRDFRQRQQAVRHGVEHFALLPVHDLVQLAQGGRQGDAVCRFKCGQRGGIGGRIGVAGGVLFL